MKLQIRFTIRDEENDKDLARSKTFTNVDPLADNDSLINFAKAYMSLTTIRLYEVVKITEENIEVA